MLSSVLNCIVAVLFAFISSCPESVVGVDYASTCTCNSVQSSVCMSYSCSTTVENSGCFPASSKIILEDGSVKDLSDIKIGDRVLVDENDVYEPIIAFFHGKHEGLFEFLAIDVQSSRSNMSSTMFVSVNHLIFDFNARKARFAGSFSIGDQVQLIENAQMVPGTISNIRLTKQKGFYAPLTPSGTIVVDGVLASNYATVSNHDLAHNIMSIYRWWINLVGPPTFGDQIHWVLQLMSTAEKIIRWSGAQVLLNNHIYDGTFQVSSFV